MLPRKFVSIADADKNRQYRGCYVETFERLGLHIVAQNIVETLHKTRKWVDQCHEVQRNTW